MAGLFLVGLWVAACERPAYAQGAPEPGVYYAPEANLQELDVAAIRSAYKRIDLAAYSLTDQAIIDALAAQAKGGVTVRIYLDRGELQSQCRGDANCSRSPIRELMGLRNVEIKVKRSLILMHLKTYSVDYFDASGIPECCLVRDGSANFSLPGESRQDNSAIFTRDPKRAGIFALKFGAMWNRADNLTVAEAVAAGAKPEDSKPSPGASKGPPN